MEEMKLTETEHTDLDELHLLPFTDPLLKRKPKPFDFDKEDAKAIKDKLIAKMYELGGVGLSANQVGIDRAVFVVGDGQIDGMQKAFFNPEILGIGKEMESMKEGCLSFPGLWLMVSRPKQAMIKYWDEEGEEHMETYEGVTSRVIQHEYDHMLGHNFTHRVSKIKLDRAFKALDKKVKKYQRRQAQAKQA
jgi:peptide deformylase|tara:strand:- start:30038 stop:30610 length:573 start_codon:yes stop_codon:yes gene_type:complete